MSTNHESCPVCPPRACKGYPHLWRKMATDPRWRAIHDHLNGVQSEYPPVATMAGNAARAAAGFVASGLRVVDAAERGRRLDTCRGCEHFVAPANRCRKCGCSLSLKARLASSRCPIGKW